MQSLGGRSAAVRGGRVAEGASAEVEGEPSGRTNSASADVMSLVWRLRVRLVRSRSV